MQWLKGLHSPSGFLSFFFFLIPVGLDIEAKLKKRSVILNPSLEEKSKEYVINEQK